MKKEARELVRIAKTLIAADLAEEFLREHNSGKWNHTATFPGKKKPGKRPKHINKVQRKLTRDEVDRVVVEPISFNKTDDMVVFTFKGTKGRADTYVLSKVPYADLVEGAKPPKPRKKQVWEIAEEVKEKLEAGGLRSLGGRHGKAGDWYGIAGGARAIAVGKREFLLNVFTVSINDEYTLKKPAGGWRMGESELLSKVTDKEIADAIKWAKKSPSMIEVRDKAREEYWEKGSSFVSGGMRLSSRSLKADTGDYNITVNTSDFFVPANGISMPSDEWEKALEHIDDAYWDARRDVESAIKKSLKRRARAITRDGLRLR